MNSALPGSRKRVVREVGQTFNDQNEEDRIRRFQEAHEAEMVERAVAQMPPSYKHRPTAFYNLVNHEVANQDMLKWTTLRESMVPPCA